MYHTPSALVTTVRKIFMIIGTLLFIAISSMTLMITGTTEAAKNSDIVQPELQAQAIFMQR